MGTLVTHRCSDCGYEADVSGGPDAGMLVETMTMSCGRCHAIVDVVVSHHDRKRSAQPAPTCPDCGAHPGHLVEWTTGGPCPKCDGSMAAAADGFIVISD
jgi:DNA-directed RNA polymerase subunit RPC12/RpoP